MKKEKLFRALNDIGDDLLHMAEHKQFPNPWKKWISLAASLVLVVSLATLALPYFPMGCGAGQSEAPAETETAAPETEAPTEEVEMEEAPVEEEAAVEEEAPETEGEDHGAVQGTTMIVYGSTYYYLDESVVRPGETPANLGEEIGTVEDADDETLIGCKVYATTEATWYSNHAVQGVSVPSTIYVETANGYVYGVTYNEKTVSRYTAEDVQEALDSGDHQWIIDTFVEPMEAQNCMVFITGTLSSEDLNRLFLATLEMNTGIPVADRWMQGNELVVPVEDVRWRLERFLDDFTYDPTQTEAYDASRNCLVFPAEAVYREIDGLSLISAILENGMLYLRVNLPEQDEALYKDEVFYKIRFDTDSWRYFSRETPEGA